ncbi:MAG: pyridoxal-dependent decarboxylase [Candidatus Gracilibacteria bacterium]|nr:pyridoxal-dependent decarboxylase [Candidatus Gracilibacteria bacterium]
MNYKQILDELFSILSTYKESDIEGKLLEYYPESELKKILDVEKSENLKDPEVLFQWIKKYLQYGVKTENKQFFNRMWTGSSIPSAMGEIVASVSNTSSCTYESAPVSTIMEKYMIETVLKEVGFKNGEGQMTTGSSNANMISMLIARNIYGSEVIENGLFGNKKLIAFVNAESHYSMDKAANIVGIGVNNLLKVPVGNDGGMDISKLELLIQEEQNKGNIVCYVGATAGTTVRGAYDNLLGLNKLKEKYNFWLHVDGAWGGSIIFSDTLRKKYLQGIKNVDSFTFDFHKMPGVALMCNIFLINNKPGSLNTHCCIGSNEYIFNQDDESCHFPLDLGKNSLQCGSRVDSLKLFLEWKYYGKSGIAEKIERYYELIQYAEQYVHKSEELELALPLESFNLCFVYKNNNLEKQNTINKSIRENLYTSGKSLVGSSSIDGVYFMRLLVCNEYVHESDIDQFFENVIEEGRRI